MARLSIPLRKTSAIYIKQTSNGVTQYIRQPYNVVSLDFGDGSPVSTYVEICSGGFRSPSERQSIYDEIRIYDGPPFPLTQIGYGQIGQ